LKIDRRFKAASQTLENKNSNVQYYFEVELTFGMIGNATADKMTAKVVCKNSSSP